VLKEFLELPLTDEDARPIGLETLVALRPGQAMARLGGGAFVLPLRTHEPLGEPEIRDRDRTREVSWEVYGVHSISKSVHGVKEPRANDKASPSSSEDFLE
jgi:hypothetical protein